jgi:LysM repeat protein
LTRTPVRASVANEQMFWQDGVRPRYPRPQRRRGWGRIVVLAAALVLATGRLAYGSGPPASDRVVVAAGDTIWSIAAAHYRGDPRPHVEAILQANRLSTPLLMPGQTLQLPRE